MDIFEVEQKERLSREEVAARLRNLADMLARHNDIEFERGGMRFTVNVPDELERQGRARGREREARAGNRTDLVSMDDLRARAERFVRAPVQLADLALTFKETTAATVDVHVGGRASSR